MLVQLFYAWRIHKLTRNVWLVGAVVTTSLVGGRRSLLPLVPHVIHPSLQHLSDYLTSINYLLQWLVSERR